MPVSLIRLGILPALLLALAACNTIGGFGEDVQSGGQAIEDTAEEVQE